MSCVDEILEAGRKAGVVFEEGEAEAVFEILNERLQKRVENAGEGEELEVLSLAREIAKQARINAVMQKRNRLLNAKAYADIMRFVQQSENPAEALSAIMVGSFKYAEGGMNSVDARQQGIMSKYAGELLAALHKERLDKLFLSKELEGKVFQAMFDGDDFDVNVAGGAEAKRIAEIIQITQKRMLKRKNQQGAMIAELKNYAVRQSHDPILLRAGAKTSEELNTARNTWVEYMLKPDVLDPKTFENKPPTKDGEPYTNEQFLADMWDNLVSGQHDKVDALRGDDGQADSFASFTGPANLAKKLSQSRIIHFKNGAAAHAYFKKYSRMSLSDAVMNAIQHDAQSIGLMEKFGTNPKSMFDRVIDDIKKMNKGDATRIDQIVKKERSLTNQFRELDGTTRARGAGRPVLFGADFAGIAAGWRMLQNMSKLGMATITSFSDIASKASFINSRTDRGIFTSYARAFSDIFRNYNSQDQKRLAFLLNVGVDGYNGDVFARFGANDSGPGKLAKAHNIFFRLNGMNYWNNAQKVGLAKMLAADLATYADRGFGDLPNATRFDLQRYGINETEWSLMRQMELEAVDGNKYMTSSGLDALPDSSIAQAALAKANETRKRKLKQPTQAMIDKYRDDLSTKIATYLTDAADTAIPTPGAKERAIMNQGLERGTVLGESIRAMMQLKGFPITYISKGMTGQYYAKKQLSGMAPNEQQFSSSGMVGLAQMMVGATMMGYLSVQLKEILKGKEPLEVFSDETALNPELLTKAMLQGGGMGIYGDFLFGEYNKYGQTLSQSLLGPTFGSIDDIARIYNNVLSGDVDAITKNATRFAISNTPGYNLFYTKTALDYLFIYGLMERSNPGYLRRMERRMKRDMEQEFYFPPSRYANTF
tara:strand:+ start:1121 stop:3766 length:2646 start_codon:yes stop_codon:yes gene_type:complete